MSKEMKRIRVTPDGELARVLTEAAVAPVLIERDGELYRLNRVGKDGSEDIFAQYDPLASVAGIRAAAGSWEDVDMEAFNAYIHARRRTSSRPSVRL